MWPEVKKRGIYNLVKQQHLLFCFWSTISLVACLVHEILAFFLFFFLPSSPALYLPPPPPDFNLSPSNSTTHTPPNGVCQCAQSWLSMHSELRIKAAALLNASKVICNARACVFTCHSRSGIGKDKAFFQIPPPVPYTLYRHSDAV